MEKVLVFLNKYKYQVIIVLIIILSLSIVGLVLYSNNKKVVPEEIVDEVSVLDKEVEENSIEVDKIKVDIKGAVVNPSVYELGMNSRVIDVINISGGLLESADVSILNLSKKLKDEDVIIIYTKEEVKKIKEGNVVIQYIEKECNCPNVNNSACIDPDSLISDIINQEEDSVETESNDKDNIKKISINTASLDELQTLAGIGKSKAEAIIEYRTTNGLFKTIEEIKNVSGIGDAAFEKIKDNITT